jgi:predicted membrane-bound spermidine synthase
LRISRTLSIATLLFFCSGALGLGYELIWIRKAALVVGASQMALSTVLTSFFLGLGLGSYFVGRRRRGSKRSPLFTYGLFEVGIGLFALAFPMLFDLLEAAYSALYPLAEGSQALLFGLRFTLLFLLCLPPTFLMGGTLPLLLDALVQQGHSIGARTSFLYGTNILGAVVGVLITCYFAIPVLGMNGTSILGGIGNIALGLIALVSFRALRAVHRPEPTGPTPAIYLGLAFAAGFVAIGFQIVWLRYFTLFHTMSVYFTAVFLAVFLLALATGSLLLAPLLGARWRSLRIVACLQAVVPLWALWGLEAWRAGDYEVRPATETLPDGRIELVGLDHDYPGYWHLINEAVDATFLVPLFQTALVIFIPVVLMGATLPALIAAATRQSSALRAVSGRMVLSNTLGSSLGGFAGGYVLLPTLGMHWTLVALGVGSIAIAVAAQVKAQQGSGEDRAKRSTGPRVSDWSTYALQGIGLLGIIVFVAVKKDTTWRTIEVFGYGRDFGAIKQGLELIDVIEGPLNTSFVFDGKKSKHAGSGHVALAALWKEQPSTQAIQGHVPALLYPGTGLPHDCLGICLGSGQSFGALLAYEGTRHFDIVDISTEIVELCERHFSDVNHELHKNPAVKFHLDDGRHFVERAANASYDVISMEPPPPTADGVYSLYSLEFYQECHRLLRSTGVFMQWLPLYRVTPMDLRGIVRTQAEVFPETFVIKVGVDDFMVVSYKEKPRFHLASIRDRCKVFENERHVRGHRWAGDLSHHEMASLEAVLALIIMGPEDIAGLTDGLIYRDDTQALSYTSGDRHLLRLFRGPLLSKLSFAELTLTPFAALNDAEYFEPALSAAQIEELERERAACLGRFRVPPPEFMRPVVDKLESARQRGDWTTVAKHTTVLAYLMDGPLWKEKAYALLAHALNADPTLADAASLAKVTTIARNHISVFADDLEALLDGHTLPGVETGNVFLEHSTAPIVRALRTELDKYRRLEKKARGLYLFP